MTAQTLKRGPWTFKWSGGRLADVHYPGKGAVDCIDVGYDWEKCQPTATRESFRAAVDQWMVEDEPSYRAELPYL